MSDEPLAQVAHEEFFAVAIDPETYQTKECLGLTIVETWTEFMFCPVDQADPEEIEQFREFANDGDNWHGCSGVDLDILTWEIHGEGGGTITFYRKTE